MMRARWTMAGCSSLLLLLLLGGLLGGGSVRAICPSVCLCSRGHRVVDCSSRGLTKLPPGLQHNIHFLNLSFNSLQTLDTELSHYGHLRTLDLSYNRLERLPAALPRSLWELRAAGNHLRSLDKNDTAYHWNLRQLDLSANELERVVFINNTLPELRVLNLSHNRFWTVPTNLPRNLQAVDLSHNFLLQILAGSLDRLPRLARLYLHANRFTGLDANRRGDAGGFGFERLSALQLVTLGDNPWACEEEEDIARLLRWAERAAATVLGCPCHTRPVCGGQKDRAVATATDTATDTVTELPPLWVDSSRGDDGDGEALDDGLEATSGYRGKSAARFETGLYHRGNNESGWMSSTSSSAGFSSTSSRMMSSTLKPKVSRSQNSAGVGLRLQSVTLTVLMTTATINSF